MVSKTNKLFLVFATIVSLSFLVFFTAVSFYRFNIMQVFFMISEFSPELFGNSPDFNPHTSIILLWAEFFSWATTLTQALFSLFLFSG